MVRQPASQRAVAQNEINKDNMKIIRNIARRPWPRIGGWLPVVMLICGVLASCSSEDESTTPLPDGKYPLQLTAEVARPQTRAGGKDAWTGGEEIGVTVEGYIGGMPKTYVMDASGNAAPKDAANAIYWKNTAEARIYAWTPNIVNPAVDISDQTNGYADFDVLYASAIGRYNQTINLRFNHRMAKMEITLAAGEGVTNEAVEGATVTLLGDSEAYFSGGMVGAADQSDGEIRPYRDAATKKYEAVVVPQDMTGKPLIRIAVGSDVFTYTPDTDAAGNLKAGKRYAYTITVKANGIDVQSVTSGTWVANGEENVTSKRVKQRFTADELKIGDYFYSDGTWSDGGLRKIYADGSMHIDYYKPVPLRGKTVVGIVFQTDKSRIGKKEKEKLGGENKAHGLVMAVKNANAAEKVIWSNESRYLDLLNDCVSKSNNYSDISGYGNCESIRSLEGNFDKYPALQAVDGYNTTCPVPTTTTGWYLPSSGQWWDILQNLGGCPALADGYQQTSSDINEFFWSNQGNVPDALNKWMWGIDGWDKFSYYHQFWSSSKFKGNTMRYWVANSDDGWISCRWGNVNFQLYVRPVLAF